MAADGVSGKHPNGLASASIACGPWLIGMKFHI
jgi:hypothetical protein